MKMAPLSVGWLKVTTVPGGRGKLRGKSGGKVTAEPAFAQAGKLAAGESGGPCEPPQPEISTAKVAAHISTLNRNLG